MVGAVDIEALPTVLDPACGGGIFLITLAEKLYDKHKLKKHSERVDVVKKCLFGVDRSPQASEVSRLCVLLSTLVETDGQVAPLETLNQNFRCGNTLITDQQDQTGRFQGLSFEKAFGRKTFDIIIANPPYGISRNEQIPAKENALLKKIYRETLSGKPNKYLLFLVRCISLLKKDGQLSFLIPNSWLGIRSGKSVREFLLSEKLISKIDTFDSYLFRDAGVEVILLHASRHSGGDSFQVAALSSSLKTEDSYRIKYDYAYNLHDHYIPINWNSAVLEVIEEIQKSSISLESLYHPTIALQAYATGKGVPAQTTQMVKEHVYHSDTKQNDTYIPYLAGKDVKRFELSWSGDYLSHGEWLADAQPLVRYTTPRVLVREILGEAPYLFQATYTDAPYLYNKSILHITTGGDDSTEKLMALTAVLNSATASFLIMFLGKKSARRLFPKIVLDDLKHLPLPAQLSRYSSQLASVTEEAQQSGAQSVERGLEELVFDAYGLPEKHRKVIRKFTKSLVLDPEIQPLMPPQAGSRA